MDGLACQVARRHLRNISEIIVFSQELIFPHPVRQSVESPYTRSLREFLPARPLAAGILNKFPQRAEDGAFQVHVCSTLGSRLNHVDSFWIIILAKCSRAFVYSRYGSQFSSIIFSSVPARE